MTMSSLYEGTIQRPDDELVARCLRGERDAFGRLYARYERPVFRYAYYLLGHREDAADVKQETFLRAYRSLATFRGKSSLQTWLLKICVNLCRERMRARTREPLAYEERDAASVIGDADTLDPQRTLERAHTVQTILRVLDGIPAPHREIILLREIEDLNYQDIARILGCSVPTAKMRLFRARHCLKERVISVMEER